jgi:hypothetical protein
MAQINVWGVADADAVYLTGGGLRGPLCVPAARVPICDGQPLHFVHLRKSANWLCQFVSGIKSYSRPLSGATALSTIQSRAHRFGHVSASDAENHMEALKDGIVDTNGHGASRRLRLGGKRQCVRTDVKKEDVVYVVMPETPGAQKFVVIRVWLRSQGLHMLADVQCLDWLRGYMLAEIGVASQSGIQTKPERLDDGQDKTIERIWWCPSSNFFRVKVMATVRSFRVPLMNALKERYSNAEFDEMKTLVRARALEFIEAELARSLDTTSIP